MNELSPAEVTDPHSAYTRRLADRRTVLLCLERQERRMSDARLGAAIAGLLIGGLAFGAGLISSWWVLLPVIVFIGLVIAHDRTIRQTHRLRASVRFFEQGLARLEDRWAGTGTQGLQWSSAAHPYAEDLDLFGKGSLFELICSARTRDGERTLAEWLLAPSEPSPIRERQAAVAELRGRVSLREDLAVLGEAVRGTLDVEAAAEWGTAPVRLTSSAQRVGALFVAAVVAGAGIAWTMGYGPLPLLIASLLGQAYAAPLRERVDAAIKQVERTSRELGLLAQLLQRIEAERFETPLLLRLSGGLAIAGELPSRRLARLERLVSGLQVQQNGVLGAFAFVLLWSTHWAFAIEAWRAQNGPLLAGWIQAAGEFEALTSLAGYAYEHPHDPFPEIVEQGPLYCAEGLGHPLLPGAKRVRNDLRIDAGLRLLIVSGSNMSGKSTLMRAVGVNTVLALAGAPVCAHHLRLSPCAIGASIRVQDSLQDGISRFYAEILRLRQVVELSREAMPLLFLLDEILHGTNSHDRRIGAEAVIRSLVASGAVGIVTTHDLALARIADDPELPAINVHFEDQIVDGKMQFDYQLRAGVVQKSNALELMRSVGLDV